MWSTPHRTILIGCALAASVSAPCSADLLRFVLDNHPRGQIVPPHYGMRLDGLFGVNEPVTFSLSGKGASVRLDVDTDAQTIHIHGTVYGGIDAGQSFMDPQLYTLDMTYTMVENNNGGWDVGNLNGAGTLTRISDSMSWSLTTIFNELNHAFEFYPDRFRLEKGDLPEVQWVGRGWLDVPKAPMPGATRDFLFTAVFIPLPQGVWMGLIGLCGVGVAHRLRRRA